MTADPLDPRSDDVIAAGVVAAPDQTFANDVPELTVEWSADDVPGAQPVVVNDELAAELGIDPGWLRTPDGVATLIGRRPLAGVAPVAQVYAGHQFGSYSPRLGDGRALLLGEVVAPDGRRLDLHVKGAGRTPFARGGDGKATLGPMLREYVFGEAMAALGVPTSRMLAVVATGEHVARQTLEPGAMVVRVAASHLRVGTFQWAAATGDVEVLRRLTDHAIARHHPDARDTEVPALGLLDAVVAAQVETVARWMEVGFVHGVMNTDNVTISGETIDFGPCAFLDAHRSGAVFSSIDHGGRYAYGRQPAIMAWDLARFAETLLPLVHDDTDRAVEAATEVLSTFGDRFGRRWTSGMLAKIGLVDAGGGVDVTDAEQQRRARAALAVMDRHGLDHTNTFRALADTLRAGEPDALLAVTRGRPVRTVDLENPDPADDPAVESTGAADPDDDIVRWWTDWVAAVDATGRDRTDVAAGMDAVNPVNVPRNHLVEDALDAAVAGDLAAFVDLVDVVRRPFDPHHGDERYRQPAPADASPHRTFCGT